MHVRHESQRLSIGLRIVRKGSHHNGCKDSIFDNLANHIEKLFRPNGRDNDWLAREAMSEEYDFEWFSKRATLLLVNKDGRAEAVKSIYTRIESLLIDCKLEPFIVESLISVRSEVVSEIQARI